MIIWIWKRKVCFWNLKISILLAESSLNFLTVSRRSGDEVTTENGIRLVVESVEKNRIGQVHIYLPSPENPEELPEN